MVLLTWQKNTIEIIFHLEEEKRYMISLYHWLFFEGSFALGSTFNVSLFYTLKAIMVHEYCEIRKYFMVIH